MSPCNRTVVVATAALMMTFLSACHRVAPSTFPNLDADRDGIPDFRDCVLGESEDVRTTTLGKIVVSVDGSSDLQHVFRGRHRIGLSGADLNEIPEKGGGVTPLLAIAEFDWDCRRGPLVLSGVTVERQGDPLRNGFTLVVGVPRSSMETIDLFVPLGFTPSAQALPRLCVGDLGSVHTASCSGSGERTIDCSSASAGGRSECVVEPGNGRIRLRTLLASRGLAPSIFVADSCDPALDPTCSGDPRECLVDADRDGVPNCRDCRPNDPMVYPGAPEIHCNNRDENCDCNPSHCVQRYVDCLRRAEGSVLRSLIELSCAIERTLCVIGCGDPSHSQEGCDVCEFPICDAAINPGNTADAVCPDRANEPVLGCDEKGLCWQKRCQSGRCSPPLVTPGAACEDGNPCTTSVCSAEGACTPTPVSDFLSIGSCSGVPSGDDPCGRRCCIAGKCDRCANTALNGTSPPGCEWPPASPLPRPCAQLTCKDGVCAFFADRTSGPCTPAAAGPCIEKMGECSTSGCVPFYKAKGTSLGIECSSGVVLTEGCSLPAGTELKGELQCDGKGATICVARPGVDYCTAGGQTVGGKSCGLEAEKICEKSDQCTPNRACIKECEPDFKCRKQYGQASSCGTDLREPNCTGVVTCWMPGQLSYDRRCCFPGC